jgi:hypothetical protein
LLGDCVKFSDDSGRVTRNDCVVWYVTRNNSPRTYYRAITYLYAWQYADLFPKPDSVANTNWLADQRAQTWCNAREPIETVLVTAMIVICNENTTGNQNVIANGDLISNSNVDMIVDLYIVSNDQTGQIVIAKNIQPNAYTGSEVLSKLDVSLTSHICWLAHEARSRK